MPDQLDRVRRASAAITAAEDRRAEVVRAAHAAGESVTDLALAAGVSRPSIYRMVEESGRGAWPPPTQWRQILTDAAWQLAEHGASLPAVRAAAESGLPQIQAKRLQQLAASMTGRIDLDEAWQVRDALELAAWIRERKISSYPKQQEG